MKNIISIQSYSFECHTLGDSAVVLSTTRKFNLNEIHEVGNVIRNANIKEIIDIVVAYQSITIYFNPYKISSYKLIRKLSEIEFKKQELTNNQRPIIYQIPVDFEKGMDWKAVEEITKLSKAKIINIFTSTTYQVAMLGFIPGFVYLEGLDERLECRRRAIPRTKVPKGAIGIGGKQAGIYGLESPGGWQIIGQTTFNLFDIDKEMPIEMSPLDEVRFISIH
jgi:inhibitor of KinA